MNFLQMVGVARRQFYARQKYKTHIHVIEQGQNTSKKKMTLSRILKGLKTHKKEKHGQIHSSPQHGLPSRTGLPQRVRNNWLSQLSWQLTSFCFCTLNCMCIISTFFFLFLYFAGLKRGLAYSNADTDAH